MSHRSRRYVQRLWPLAFALPAALGLFSVMPHLYRSFEFAHYSATAKGWYTNVDDPEYVYYAYSVDGRTYSGTISTNDLGSDFYFRRPGDNAVWVRYLSRRPWVSEAGQRQSWTTYLNR